mmetsp:Transcript_41015/g.54016  ORF Transcript_41015/g.54016 Transcript_41015/m.54016 type:complete len:138 (+) Transcript_41015:2-415(+)
MYESQDGYKKLRAKIAFNLAASFVSQLQDRALFFISSLRPEFERWDTDEDGYLYGMEIKACLRTLGLTKRIEANNMMVKRAFSKLANAKKYSIKSYLELMPPELLSLVETNLKQRKTLSSSTTMRLHVKSRVELINF